MFSAVTSSPPPPSVFPPRPEFVSDRLVHQYYSPPVFVSSHADRSLCPITLPALLSPGKPKPASHLDLQASGPKSSCTFLHLQGFTGTIEEIKAADKSKGCHDLGKKDPPPLNKSQVVNTGLVELFACHLSKGGNIVLGKQLVAIYWFISVLILTSVTHAFKKIVLNFTQNIHICS